MTPTPVGMRCPECSRQRTKVKTAATIRHGEDPIATYVIMGICVALGLGALLSGGQATGLGDTLALNFGLDAPDVAGGDVYRLVTAGFLHASIIHVGFNMYILWFLGNLIEPALGPVRFLALYFASLLAGSFGALLLSPNALTVGASGAIFGLMGATFAMQRARGIDPMQSGIGPLILFNLILGFVIPNVSVAAHVGGLIGGGLVGFLMDHVARYRRDPWLPLAICVAVGVAAVVGSVLVV
jgi:membrane associated rhomboid family serine protease